MRSETLTIEAGQYWIGDPCYVLSEEMYDEMINSVNDDQFDYQYEVNGHTITVLHTEYGDGEFPASSSRAKFHRVAVDSDQIAAVPMALINPNNENLQFGFVDTLLAGTAYRDDQGELFFSCASVATGWEEEEEAEEESYEEPESYEEAEGF